VSVGLSVGKVTFVRSNIKSRLFSNLGLRPRVRKPPHSGTKLLFRTYSIWVHFFRTSVIFSLPLWVSVYLFVLAVRKTQKLRGHRHPYTIRVKKRSVHEIEVAAMPWKKALFLISASTYVFCYYLLELKPWYHEAFLCGHNFSSVNCPIKDDLNLIYDHAWCGRGGELRTLADWREGQLLQRTLWRIRFQLGVTICAESSLVGIRIRQILSLKINLQWNFRLQG
jgi:hypothetical protein